MEEKQFPDFDPTGTVQGITWDHSPKKDRLTDAEIEAVKAVQFKDKVVKIQSNQ